jgi:hypothetical protein
LLFFLDSYSPIFEDLSKETKADGRDGAEQRLQCEGSRWGDALDTWLRAEKTALKKQREEANRRKEKEAAPAPKKKKKKIPSLT